MKAVSELVVSLKSCLNWNKARITCFAQMLLGLISVRTVNLQEIALAISSPTQVSSRYRRLQRFFATFEIDFTVLARYIFKLFLVPSQKYYVVIDRTNWYWGKHKINVFVLSVAYEGLAIPLFWQVLSKGGCSNFKEQKHLVQQFMKTFGSKDLAGLLADREFASGQFFAWLNRNKLPFYIRIKANSVVSMVGKKHAWTAKQLFKQTLPTQCELFGMRVKVLGEWVYLSGSRSIHKRRAYDHSK